MSLLNSSKKLTTNRCMAPHFSLFFPIASFSILLLNVEMLTDRTLISGMHISLQPLDECHCWWTRVSPRAHVAKFYVRLQLIRSALRASKFSVLKFIEIVILVDLLHDIPFGFRFFWYFCDISFQLFKLLFLAKNHWRGFCTLYGPYC